MKNVNKTVRKYVTILGINVLSTSIDEVLTGVKEKISYNAGSAAGRHKFYITTPNPELVLMAQKDKDLKEALNSSDFSVPDGIGLAQAVKFLSMRQIETPVVREITYFFQGLMVGAATFFSPKWLTEDFKIVKGRVLFNDLIKLSDKNRWKVFFLGGENNEAELAAKKLMIRDSKFKIQWFRGPIVDNNAKPATELDIDIQKDAIDKINKFAPDLLFVAMKNPKQEKWIYRNISKLNIKGAMTVGGTFRYIAGASKLPPDWLAGFGLEWLWRLLTEPYRVGRIFNALVLFPLKVWIDKLHGKLLKN